MHGTEHWQPGMPGVSPFHSPMTVFPGLRISALWLAATSSRLAPVSRNGLSLACNGCSFAEASIPGSTFPACSFETLPDVSPVRSVRRSTTARRFAPVRGRFFAPYPFRGRHPFRWTAPAVSAPLQGCYPPSDQSVRPPGPSFGPPSGFARFPLAPRRLFYR
jgi:hypothetical protein